MAKINTNVIYTSKILKNVHGGLQYMRPGDAGFDIRAVFDLDTKGVPAVQVTEGRQVHAVTCTIEPGEQVTFPTGFKIEVPEGYMLAVYPRGGKGCEGLVLGNLVGVIDHQYQGEVFVCLWNRSFNPITITAFDRVAQGVLQPVTQAVFKEVEKFTAPSARGEGKLNSSGEA